ncbi:MAG: MCE-family protein MceF [Marmoricola sp.]|nr:MCE-family protein MceF [Marmoricola sp.]
MKVFAIFKDRLWQSFFGVVLVLIITLAYLFSSVLGTPLLGGTKVVKVEMAATGGLFEGSAVTYRGVKIGKVRTIDLTSTGVVATIAITSSDNIPTDSLVKVRSLSPVGEQYLDFQPRTDKGPFLHDGSVVPATSTDLPKTLASTVIAVNKVLAQINTDQLHSLLTELSTGLAGTGDDLGKLVDQGHVLLVDLDRLWPQTDRLITNGGAVLSIGPSKANDIRQLATSSRLFAQFLRSYDPQLRSTLAQAPAQIAQLHGLITDAATIFPGFVGEAVTFSDLFRSYSPQLGALLAWYAPGLGVLGRAVKDGVLQIEGIPQRSTECPYPTTRRDPTNAVRRPLVTTGHCASGHANLQRGAAHAPGPVQ